MKNRLIAGLTLAIPILFAFATATSAHAELESSDPAGGATIKTPYALTATFSEELKEDGSSIVVQDASGAEVARGSVSASDDTEMSIDLPELPDGEYEVLWTAVTADDNGITRGTYQFAVDANFTPSGTTSPTTAPTASAATTPSAAASAAPTAAASNPALSTPAPAPSAAPGQNTGSGNDLLLPLAAVIVIVVAIAGFLLYRNRRSE